MKTSTSWQRALQLCSRYQLHQLEFKDSRNGKHQIIKTWPITARSSIEPRRWTLIHCMHFRPKAFFANLKYVVHYPCVIKKLPAPIKIIVKFSIASERKIWKFKTSILLEKKCVQPASIKHKQMASLWRLSRIQCRTLSWPERWGQPELSLLAVTAPGLALQLESWIQSLEQVRRFLKSGKSSLLLNQNLANSPKSIQIKVYKAKRCLPTTITSQSSAYPTRKSELLHTSNNWWAPRQCQRQLRSRRRCTPTSAGRIPKSALPKLKTPRRPMTMSTKGCRIRPMVNSRNTSASWQGSRKMPGISTELPSNLEMPSIADMRSPSSLAREAMVVCQRVSAKPLVALWPSKWWWTRPPLNTMPLRFWEKYSSWSGWMI